MKNILRRRCCLRTGFRPQEDDIHPQTIRNVYRADIYKMSFESRLRSSYSDRHIRISKAWRLFGA